MDARMARMARAVAAGVPHHVTQRGNRRQRTFFRDADYRLYCDLLGQHCRTAEVAIWAWCLMPNHVHLVLVPTTADGLARAIGDTHRDYSRTINRREGWTGYLWQGRFASCPMDEPHCIQAIRYIERNPVRADLARHPAAWPWSSARTHLGLATDGLVDAHALDPLVPDWPAFLADTPPDWRADELRSHTRTGRPLGDSAFITRIEQQTGRHLRPARRGRPASAQPQLGAQLGDTRPI
jgi:putative transposase